MDRVPRVEFVCQTTNKKEALKLANKFLVDLKAVCCSAVENVPAETLCLF